jgi:uncharacterized phage protein (predicted DNA packaging)
MPQTLMERVNIDLGLLKQYLKIEHDYDDEILSELIEAAKEQVGLYLNTDFVGVGEDGESVEIPIPFSVTLAIKRLVGFWYENREAGIVSKQAGGITVQVGDYIPQDILAMLVMYRRLAGT